MTATTHEPGSPIPERTIPTRQLKFRFGPDELPKHYADGDLVMSHVIAVLSSLFPEGESFFVRSVRHYKDRIIDPELSRQVTGFIGQESVHGREHRAFNDQLAEMGYPTHLIDRATKRGLALLARVSPKRDQLAVTAALEHYTATLAWVLMSDDDARSLISADEVRHLFLWHALEESEHKAVAFDVFQQVSGDNRVRTWTMHATTAVFLAVTIVGTVVSLLHDRAAYRPRTLLRSLRRLRTSPWLTRDVVRMIRDYHRADFHPDDHDTSDLLEHWRAELLGPEGTISDRLAAKKTA
jgi:uncharacterized protein